MIRTKPRKKRPLHDASRGLKALKLKQHRKDCKGLKKVLNNEAGAWKN